MPTFKKKGEFCLSMMLAHFRMGEVCPTYGYFIIWNNLSLFEPRF